MKRTGFMLETITTYKGKKEKRIQMHTIEDIDYVTFYKDDRLIPIPYDCLVCFVAQYINEPKQVPKGIAELEKFIIDTQEAK
jgi:hypothetical protein